MDTTTFAVLSECIRHGLWVAQALHSSDKQLPSKPHLKCNTIRFPLKRLNGMPENLFVKWSCKLQIMVIRRGEFQNEHYCSWLIHLCRRHLLLIYIYRQHHRKQNKYVLLTVTLLPGCKKKCSQLYPITEYFKTNHPSD